MDISNQIISNVSEGIVIYDKGFNYVVWNPAMEKITGYKAADVIGKKASEVFPYIKKRGLEQHFHNALRGVKVKVDGILFENPKSRESKWFSSTYSPFYDANREICGVMAIISDITDLKENENILKERTEEIQAQNEEYVSLNEELRERNQEYEALYKRMAASEFMYRTIIETSPDVIITTDLTGNITFASSRSLNLFGVPSVEKILGVNILQYIHPNYHSISANNLQKIISNNKPFTETFLLIKENRDTFFAEVHSSLITNNDGEPEAILSVIRDINERKKIEERMLLQKKKMESIYRGAPVGIGMSVNHTILEINESFCTITGYRRSELIGQSSRMLYLNQMAFEQVGTLAIENYTEFILRSFETQWMRKDGRIIDVLLHFTPLEAEKPDNGIVFTAQDITERKHLEKELIRQKNKAEESEKLKTAFLENISHEIRTPMNGIIGFSQLLSNQLDNPEELQRSIEIIDRCCRNLLSIINEIIEISRIETGQAILSVEKCDMDLLLTDMLSLASGIKKQTGKSKISMICHPVPRNRDIEVFTDCVKIRQIFSSLIHNAIKYTDQGSIEFGFHSTQGRQVIFFVSDTGKGIPEELHDSIFERFVQIHPESTFREGLGVGLSIVKGLVKLLRGNVWLESEVGQGSTFYFSIDGRMPVKTNYIYSQTVN
jgi:PAS domain S-box-containing protein